MQQSLISIFKMTGELALRKRMETGTARHGPHADGTTKDFVEAPDTKGSRRRLEGVASTGDAGRKKQGAKQKSPQFLKSKPRKKAGSALQMMETLTTDDAGGRVDTRDSAEYSAEYGTHFDAYGSRAEFDRCWSPSPRL